MPILQQNSRQNKVNVCYNLLFHRYYFNVKEVNADDVDLTYCAK